MKIRFPNNCSFSTTNTIINSSGQMEVQTIPYNIDAGKIYHASSVVQNEDYDNAYDIMFEPPIIGVAFGIPKDQIEIMAEGYVHPNPPERCCNHG